MGSSPATNANFVLYTATANVKPEAFATDLEITSYGRIFYSTDSNGVTGTYAYIGTQMPYTTTASTPEADQGGVWTSSNTTGIWLKLGQSNVFDLLSASDGEKYLGVATTITALRSIEPTVAGQRIWLREYASGTRKGSGYFVYDSTDTSSADDSGYIIVTTGGKRWKRAKTPEQLTVLDFGAVMDGTTDDMPAVKLMYTATRNLSSAFPVGIRIPAGSIALKSTFDTSTATEQPMFCLKGPDVDYGVNPKARVYFLDTTSTTPVFQVNARRTEITGLQFQATGTTTPFFKNVCPAGQYYRVSAIRCNGNGGLVFNTLDTIDTKFDQIYCYSISGGFLRALWSNTTSGAWDHSTAIELSNSNFTSCKTIDTIVAIRAGQCIMRNVWFTNCEYPYDLSQAGWLMDTVIMEGSTYPGKTKQAKLVQINCRFAQGATNDDTLTGYTSDMDNGGSIPSWVGNAYDQGNVRINVLGSYFDGPLASRFDYSEQLIDNSNSAATWYDLGRIALQGLGRTAHIKVTGAQGWDSISSTITRPNATGYGGGQADIYIELKYPSVANSSSIQVHWHGTAGCPITAVKYVHSWQTFRIYVQMATYAVHAAVWIDGVGTVRNATGNPLYTLWSGAEISDVDSITNIQTAACRWAVGNGNYSGGGFGMDFDNGMLMYSGTITSNAAATFLPMYLGGTKYYLGANPTANSIRIPRFTQATMPSASANVYGICLCTDTIMSPATQLMYSNGSNWYAVGGTTSWVTT